MAITRRLSVSSDRLQNKKRRVGPVRLSEATTSKSPVRSTRSNTTIVGSLFDQDKPARVHRGESHKENHAIVAKEVDSDTVGGSEPSSRYHTRRASRLSHYSEATEVVATEVVAPAKTPILTLHLKPQAETVPESKSADDSDVSDDEDDSLYEELPKFEYESQYSDDDEKDPFEMELLATSDDLPVVDLSDAVLSPSPSPSLVDSPREVVQMPRWPIDEQDDSTTFSILVAKTADTVSPVPQTPDVTSRMDEAKTVDEPSIDDFLDYESVAGLTDDDSDGLEASSSGAASPVSTTSSSSSTSTSSSLASLWNSNGFHVPIFSYRNRNNVADTNMVPPNSKLLAALSSITTPDTSSQSAPLKTAFYQQAVIVANGLNKRSLLSGKARQMVSSARGSDIVF